MHCPVSQSSRA